MFIGLDIKNPNVLVNWPVYLDLYCIFEAGRIDKTNLIKFWIRFFDPLSRGKCPEQEYLKLLEELIRGNTLDKPIRSTMMFAEIFQKKFARNDCLGPENEIINEKLAQAFEDGRINIQLLCNALGKSELDESFF